MGVRFDVNIKLLQNFPCVLFHIFVLGVSSPLRCQATLVNSWLAAFHYSSSPSGIVQVC